METDAIIRLTTSTTKTSTTLWHAGTIYPFPAGSTAGSSFNGE